VKKRVLASVVFALFALSCADREFKRTPRYEGVYGEPPTVRILLADNFGPERKVTLEAPGNYMITTAKGVKFEGSNLPESLLRVDDDGVHIGSHPFGPGYLKLHVEKDGSLAINGRKYRGSLLVIPGKQRHFTLINELDLESYLRGVIAGEMPSHWPQAALRAQAIASRTYALWRIKTSSKKTYDVTADIYSQVYAGIDSETEATDKAVAATRGVVMLYNKMLFPAYFHSCCGGHTADAYTVWREYKIPPLSGVKSEYCKHSPAYSWRQHFTEQFIIRALKKYNPKLKLSNLTDIVRKDIDASGHASRVKLVFSDGDYEITADALRKYLGKDKYGFLALRSTNFTVAHRKGQFWFLGKGNGHGVGMCQWCAYEMARQNFTASRILAHFYPQSKLWRLW